MTEVIIQFNIDIYESTLIFNLWHQTQDAQKTNVK